MTTFCFRRALASKQISNCTKFISDDKKRSSERFCCFYWVKGEGKEQFWFKNDPYSINETLKYGLPLLVDEVQISDTSKVSDIYAGLI